MTDAAPQPTPITPARGRGFTPYLPPARRDHITLKLDTNEGPTPPDGLLCALGDLPPDAIRRYPDAAALERTIANLYGVDPARVVATAGVDDALFRLAAAYAGPGRRCACTDPTFAMIPRILRIYGDEPALIPWTAGPFPTDAMVAAEPDTLAYCVSPNNPTGLAATTDDVRTLRATLDAAGLASTILICDHAYIEFADDDPTRSGITLPNTVVLRTLSKAWGLAGLRVGYAICPEQHTNQPTIADALRVAGQPYAVSTPSLALAGHFLESAEDVIAGRVSQARRERDQLTAYFNARGLPTTNSQANFVLARFPSAAEAQSFEAHLDLRGIAVRPYTVAGEPCVRVSCPMDDSDCQTLMTALDAWHPAAAPTPSQTS